MLEELLVSQWGFLLRKTFLWAVRVGWRQGDGLVLSWESCCWQMHPSADITHPIQ